MADPVDSRPWWSDLHGYWRDQVLKDLVKHGVQVSAGVYVAVVIGGIGPEDARAVALAATAVVAFPLSCAGYLWGMLRSEPRLLWAAAALCLLSLVALRRLTPDSDVAKTVITAGSVTVTCVAVAGAVALIIRAKGIQRRGVVVNFALAAAAGVCIVAAVFWTVSVLPR